MKYIIPASELYQKAKEILNDGMEFVEISFMEPDEEDDLPAAVHFEAYRASDFGSTDYEEIDVVDPAAG